MIALNSLWLPFRVQFTVDTNLDQSYAGAALLRVNCIEGGDPSTAPTPSTAHIETHFIPS